MHPLPFRLSKITISCLLAVQLMVEAHAQTASNALPTDGQVKAGQVSINQSPGSMKVVQSSQKAIIDWNTFNIGRNASVEYVQPSANASILNRVANGPSDIAGSLKSNGRVFLVNPNGILFSPSAQVNVGALVAAAGRISDATWFAGGGRIDASADLVHKGEIKTASGSTLLLIGNPTDLIDGRISGPRIITWGPYAYFNLSTDSQTASNALPTDGVVKSGQADINQSPGSMTVVQNSQQAIIDWNTYNIGRDASVEYVQPNTTASILNRVANGRSDIAGSLKSNGRVFLLNQNGILFSPGAQVNVGSLVAAGGTISDAAWLAGVGQTGNSADFQNKAEVVNNGGITTAAGGSVVLTGTKVHNEGSITAPHGAITLAAGDVVRFNLTTDGLIQAQVSGAAAQSLVDNAGLLDSSSGSITLAASASPGTPGGLVSNTGIIRASGIQEKGGVISLIGGDVNVLGQIDVSSSGGKGGSVEIVGDLQNGNVTFNGEIDARAKLSDGDVITVGDGGTVKTSAAQVKIGSDANVFTSAAGGRSGTWLIEPQFFGIGSFPNTLISGATLSRNLERGNVTIKGGGGYVNEPITWGASTLFTLTAEGDIVWGQQGTSDPRNPSRSLIVATGDTAGIALNFGNFDLRYGKFILSGATPTLSLNGTPYTVINARSTSTLNNILGSNLAGNFALTEDINASATAQANGGAGWLPVGSSNAPFSGQFNGFGNTISNLTINRPTTNYVGLFGFLTGTVSNLGLIDPNIFGQNPVGAIAGYSRGNVERSFLAGGTITGKLLTGGIVGVAEGRIVDTYVSGVRVNAESRSGILFGFDSGVDLSNSFYDLGNTQFNGRFFLSRGGIFSEQFADWLPRRDLDIRNYSANLPFDQASNGYLVSNVQGFKDALGFSENRYQFSLTNDLDFSTNPGLYMPFFRGEFRGNGHTISKLNLSDNRLNNQFAGLFGTNVGTVSNLVISNATVSGRRAGAVVGQNFGSIIGVHASGEVAGEVVGGLVGDLRSGSIRDSLSSVNVTSGETFIARAGGLYGGQSVVGGDLINSHYDINSVTINGAHSLTPGGLYQAQYQDWVSNNKTLNLLNYSATLPFDSVTNSYSVSSVQGIKDLLGFSDLPLTKFRLGANIDLTSVPGLYLPTFHGELNGAGYKISNLSLDSRTTEYLGFVGYNYGTIQNLGVENVKLIHGSITVGMESVFGGVVAVNATGATVSNSYSKGKIETNLYGGGLVGFNVGNIENSFSTVDISRSDQNIIQSDQGIGGLVGYNLWKVISSYSSGKVSSPDGGGLIGTDFGGNVTNSFWDIQASGKVTSAGGIGKTSAEMAQQASFTGWDFKDTWRISESTSSPILRVLSKGAYDLTVTANDVTRVYGDDPLTAGGLTVRLNGLQGSDTVANLFGSLYFSGTAKDAINAGSYSIMPNGLTSPKYDLIFAPGTLTINKAPLTIIADNKTKVFGDAEPVLTSQVSGFKYADTAAVVNGISLSTSTGSAATAGSHPIVVNTGIAQNYTLLGVNGTLTVNKAPLIITADDKTKRFGDPEPTLTSNVSGLKYADTVAVINGLNLTTASGNAATVGSHPIVVNPGTAQNYTVTGVNGALVVEPIPSVQVATKSLDIVVVNTAAPARSEVTSTIATVGPVVSTQRTALFASANSAITNDPKIGTLRDCNDDRGDSCIAKPRVAVKQVQINEDTAAAGAAVKINRKRALVIGNNNYPSPLTSLEGAVVDAKGVSDLLKTQGYDVVSLFDASRSQMITGLNKLIRETESDESVLVYYAGHGHIHPGSSVGYWIPTDANFDDPRGWLSNVDIARFLANIPARQILLVSDSCFSGAITRETGTENTVAKPLGRDAILSRRSVVAISSGGEEVVVDSGLEGHSPFTYHLLKQLQASNGEIPAQAIFEQIREKIQKNATQVPVYGTILSAGHVKGGEYLLNPAKE